jgi:hypothetical protein
LVDRVSYQVTAAGVPHAPCKVSNPLTLLLLRHFVACRSVLHIHTIVEECEVTKLVHAVDMKTKEPKKVSRLQLYVTTYVILTMLTCYFDHGSGVQSDLAGFSCLLQDNPFTC